MWQQRTESRPANAAEFPLPGRIVVIKMSWLSKCHPLFEPGCRKSCVVVMFRTNADKVSERLQRLKKWLFCTPNSGLPEPEQTADLAICRTLTQQVGSRKVTITLFTDSAHKGRWWVGGWVLLWIIHTQLGGWRKKNVHSLLSQWAKATGGRCRRK